jgi:hypothetical protein
MAMNLASKFADKVSERFKAKSYTERAVNNEYNWSGVATISVYSIDTVAMGNYTRSGTARYGVVTELGNAKQDLTLARDRSFTFSIDRGNFTETMMQMRAGEALAREIEEVVVPEIDVYRLAAWNTAAEANGKDDIVADAATTASNAYSNFLALNESLSSDLVPVTGRVAFVTGAYYSFLKQSNFVLDSEAAYRDRKSGDYGTVDGVDIVVVPSGYMPANTDLILVHPSAMVSPKKLEEYKTHVDPPGINGWLVEGRTIYDAFILNNRVDGIAVHRTA